MLTVASDKARGKLGTAELDLTQFDRDGFRELVLPLNDCQYEGSNIIVGLQGYDSTGAPSQLESAATDN